MTLSKQCRLATDGLCVLFDEQGSVLKLGFELHRVVHGLDLCRVDTYVHAAVAARHHP